MLLSNYLQSERIHALPLISHNQIGSTEQSPVQFAFLVVSHILHLNSRHSALPGSVFVMKSEHASLLSEAMKES
jgi:hypothetical protein